MIFFSNLRVVSKYQPEDQIQGSDNKDTNKEEDQGQSKSNSTNDQTLDRAYQPEYQTQNAAKNTQNRIDESHRLYLLQTLNPEEVEIISSINFYPIFAGKVHSFPMRRNFQYSPWDEKLFLPNFRR